MAGDCMRYRSVWYRSRCGAKEEQQAIHRDIKDVPHIPCRARLARHLHQREEPARRHRLEHHIGRHVRPEQISGGEIRMPPQCVRQRRQRPLHHAPGPRSATKWLTKRICPPGLTTRRSSASSSRGCGTTEATNMLAATSKLESGNAVASASCSSSASTWDRPRPPHARAPDPACRTKDRCLSHACLRRRAAMPARCPHQPRARARPANR